MLSPDIFVYARSTLPNPRLLSSSVSGLLWFLSYIKYSIRKSLAEMLMQLEIIVYLSEVIIADRTDIKTFYPE